MAPPRLIIISGFSAAGKTTHSKLLARELGWQYIGMSAIRRSCIPASSSPQEEWLPAGDRLRGVNTLLDREADHQMNERINITKTPIVVDAWLQPWLCELPGAVRVWLGSDFVSRAVKAQVSRLRSQLNPSHFIAETVAKKDEFSIAQFRRLYGIEFGPDPDIFDLFLDNSQYITDPTISASDAGIRRFSPLFNAHVSALL
jgi:cytidylate kinase